MEKLKSGFYWVAPKDRRDDEQWVVAEFIANCGSHGRWTFTDNEQYVSDRQEWRDRMDIRGPIEPPKE